MKSNDLIQGKWYVCNQHPSPRPAFKFDRIESNKCFYSESKNRDGYKAKKGFIISYYYYEFTEVEMPSEAVKPTPKRKRYEKKKVEELLGKLFEDCENSIEHGSIAIFLELEQWKQVNL